MTERPVQILVLEPRADARFVVRRSLDPFKAKAFFQSSFYDPRDLQDLDILIISAALPNAVEIARTAADRGTTVVVLARDRDRPPFPVGFALRLPSTLERVQTFLRLVIDARAQGRTASCRMRRPGALSTAALVRTE